MVPAQANRRVEAAAAAVESAGTVAYSARPADSALAFPLYAGSSISSAASAAVMMITCSECELPIQGISTKLVASEPTMAPTVFAAYTPPASRAASRSFDATAASASGKLAPQRTAAGRTTHRQRTISSWNVYQGDVEIDGLIGQ